MLQNARKKLHPNEQPTWASRIDASSVTSLGIIGGIILIATGFSGGDSLKNKILQTIGPIFSKFFVSINKSKNDDEIEQLSIAILAVKAANLSVINGDTSKLVIIAALNSITDQPTNPQNLQAVLPYYSQHPNELDNNKNYLDLDDEGFHLNDSPQDVYGLKALKSAKKNNRAIVTYLLNIYKEITSNNNHASAQEVADNICNFTIEPDCL